MKVKCAECGETKTVSEHRSKSFLTCSVKCLAKYNSRRYEKKDIMVCPVCLQDFKVKKSQKCRRKYCSKKCQGTDYKTRYLGGSNPNFRNKGVDYDGYPLSYSRGRVKIHKEVVCSFLNIASIPKNFHIHHRDCNIYNNEENNLVVLHVSDHQWIHKNFGVAVLNALQDKKITLKKLCSWSRDPQKAKKLLSISILDQVGVFKSGELLETPEADNQQPSVEKA